MSGGGGGSGRELFFLARAVLLFSSWYLDPCHSPQQPRKPAYIAMITSALRRTIGVSCAMCFKTRSTV